MGVLNLVVLIPVIHVFRPEKSNTERTYKELLLERGHEFGDSEKGRVEMLEQLRQNLPL